MLDWDSSLRIIPTRVGTSSQVIGACVGMRDHPHACGDKVLQMDTNVIAQGSSPRVWGQVKDEVLTAQGAGIIPTRVGTSRIYCQFP